MSKPKKEVEKEIVETAVEKSAAVTKTIKLTADCVIYTVANGLPRANRYKAGRTFEGTQQFIETLKRQNIQYEELG